MRTQAKSNIRTGHVGINVIDVDRSAQFYMKVFGFDVLRESKEDGKRYVFIGDDQRLVLTLWQQAGAQFDAGIAGLHHLSFEVDSIDEVKEAESRLRSMNVPLLYDGIVAHSEAAASGGIFFTDPEGVRLEIFTSELGESHPAPGTGAPLCGFF